MKYSNCKIFFFFFNLNRFSDNIVAIISYETKCEMGGKKEFENPAVK